MKLNILLALVCTVLMSACTSSTYKASASETAAAARSVDALNSGSNGSSSVPTLSAPSTFNNNVNTVNTMPVAPSANTQSTIFSNKTASSNVAATASNRLTSGDVLDVNVFKV